MKKNRKNATPLNKETLFSISSPNIWTPKMEDKWLKQPAKELEKNFPPLPKCPHISRVAKKRF